MVNFQAKVNKECNGFEFPTQIGRKEFLKFLKENPSMRFEIQPIMPESKKQRKFYHGAVIPLWVYLDCKNQILEAYHEIAKIEFNGEIVATKRGHIRIGKSTKGDLNKGFLERVIENLVENYGIDQAVCLNPQLYKHFMDTIYMDGKYDTFIDYLKDLKYIPIIHSQHCAYIHNYAIIYL